MSYRCFQGNTALSFGGRCLPLALITKTKVRLVLHDIKNVEKHWINDENTTGTKSSSKVAGYQVKLYKANNHLTGVPTHWEYWNMWDLSAMVLPNVGIKELEIGTHCQGNTLEGNVL